MNFDTDRVIAQEIDWIYKNEPTFQGQGNSFVGKVGRTNNGEDIRIKIVLPEFYPITRPEVTMLNNFKHPNVTHDILELQLLEEWDPNFRLKDLISSIRRLFIHSRNAIVEEKIAIQTSSTQVEQEIMSLQNQIANYNRRINNLISNQLQEQGIQTGIGDVVEISKEKDLQCQNAAISDLLELLEIKFEEAEIDQIDFIRLYRKYVKEQYLTKAQLMQSEDNYEYSKATKRPLTS